MTTLFFDARLILEDRVEPGWALIAGDRIAQIGGAGDPPPQAGARVDARGMYLSPGFVDTHVHGGAGCDVMDGTEEAIEKIAALHARHGMTSFCPTTLTAPMERILAARDVALRVRERQSAGEALGARVLGVHLEGPFFSLRFRGAQNPSHLLSPQDTDLSALLGAPGGVLRVSASPELCGAMALGRALAERGILASVGHSDADFSIMRDAAQNGYTHLTHMFNGMSGLQSPDYYCRAGVIESGLLLGQFSAEVIADGRHMPPEMLQLLYKCKGPDNMQLTTDAMRATGMPEGAYELGGLRVLVEDDVAMLADRSSFAGSVSTADRLVRTAHFAAGFPLHEAVRMASLNHARLVGWDQRIGSIAPGKLADLLILDDSLDVQSVFIAGERIA